MISSGVSSACISCRSRSNSSTVRKPLWPASHTSKAFSSCRLASFRLMWSRQNSAFITTRILSSVKLTARMRSMTAPALLSSEGRSFAAELMSRSRLTQVAEWRTASKGSAPRVALSKPSAAPSCTAWCAAEACAAAAAGGGAPAAAAAKNYFNISFFGGYIFNPLCPLLQDETRKNGK